MSTSSLLDWCQLRPHLERLCCKAPACKAFILLWSKLGLRAAVVIMLTGSVVGCGHTFCLTIVEGMVETGLQQGPQPARMQCISGFMQPAWACFPDTTA